MKKNKLKFNFMQVSPFWCWFITIVIIVATYYIRKEYIPENIGRINNGFFWAMVAITLIYTLLRLYCQGGFLSELNRALNFIEDKSQEDYEEINDKFRDEKYKNLKNIWKHYNSSISNVEINGSKKYRQAEDAEEFYNSDVLLNEKMNTKMLKYIPQLLVGLGLLGTFWGLSQGLSQIDLTRTADVTQINKLIDGVKTSFYTSLYGIYFSVVFTINMNLFLGVIESKIGELKTKLNLIFYYNGNDFIESLRSEVRQIRISNDEMAEKITNSIEEGIGKQQRELVELVQSSVGTMSNGLSDSFEKTIGESLQAIFTTDFIEKFENIKNELIEVSLQNNRFIKEYKDEIKEVVMMSKEFKEGYVSASNSLIEETTKFNDVFTGAMIMYEKLNTFYVENKDILAGNKEIIEKIEIIVNQLESFGENQENISKIWEEYSLTFNRIDETIGTANENYISMLKDANEEYGRILEGRTAEYTSNIYNGTTKLFKEYEENLVSVIDKFNGVLKNFSAELVKRQNAIGKVGELIEANRNYIDKTREMLERVEGQQQKLIDIDNGTNE